MTLTFEWDEAKLNKTISKKTKDMQSEYDFSKGVQGKHYQNYRQGHTVKIRQTDGTVIIQYFGLEGVNSIVSKR